MIIIEADSANQAWNKALKSLAQSESGNQRFYKEESIALKIKLPVVEKIDAKFPMSASEVELICDYMQTGNREEKITHDWTKLYRHRLFAGSPSQIDFMVGRLKNSPLSTRAFASIWDHTKDQEAEISPCVYAIWASCNSGSLNLYVNARCTDAYGKLLMNLLEFIAVQEVLAEKVSAKVGQFIYISNSCHIKTSDKQDFLGFVDN